MNRCGTVYHPDLIALMKRVLDDVATTIPEADRTCAKEADIASSILECAAGGVTDPEALKVCALLAAKGAPRYWHDISPARRVV